MQIFHEAFIPRRLEEVEDYEGDFQRIVNAGMDGNLEGIYYQTITGVCRVSLQPAMPSQCLAAFYPCHACKHNAVSRFDCYASGMRRDMTGAAAQPAMVEKAQQLNTDKTIAATAAHMHPDQEDLAASLEAAQGTYGALGNGQADASKEEDTSEASYSSNRDSSSSSESGNDVSSGKERIPRFEKQTQSLEARKAERKAHKAAVKESNRARRKQKMKKHVKKRAINKHKHT